METFLTEYEKQIRKAIDETPDKYPYGMEGVPDYMARMRQLLTARSHGFLLTGVALRRTCAALGFDKAKPTYKGIFHYIDNHVG